MFIAALEYLMVFVIGLSFIAIYQKVYNGTYFMLPYTRKRNKLNRGTFCLLGCISILPVIVMFGMRYGIGGDYFSYERIYNTLHSTEPFEYFANHLVSIGTVYYVEPGYYALNYIFPNYRLLLWGCGILIYSVLFLIFKDYSKEMSFAFALFIYLTTQYLYSFNVMRFSIAVCFVLAAYNVLLQKKYSFFILYILVAASFHKTALICLMFFLLKEYKHKIVNSIRDLLLFLFILLFPLVSSFIFRIVRELPFFERYFTVSGYAAHAAMSYGGTWILHVAFILFPLLLVARKEIFLAENTSVLFRIYMMEIPFRMLTLYNPWYNRLARYTQIALVLLLPLVIAKITNNRSRMFMYVYYIAWFVFYFSYSAIVGNTRDSLPYVSIFSG